MGKFWLFGAAIDAGYVWLAVIGVLNSAISLYYYVRIVVFMYLKKETIGSEPTTSPALALTLGGRGRRRRWCSASTRAAVRARRGLGADARRRAAPAAQRSAAAGASARSLRRISRRQRLVKFFTRYGILLQSAIGDVQRLAVMPEDDRGQFLAAFAEGVCRKRPAGRARRRRPATR